MAAAVRAGRAEHDHAKLALAAAYTSGYLAMALAYYVVPGLDLASKLKLDHIGALPETPVFTVGNVRELLKFMNMFDGDVRHDAGTITAGSRGMDLLGCLLVGFITSIGGGTTRQILTGDLPVFWMREPSTWRRVGGVGDDVFSLAETSFERQVFSRNVHRVNRHGRLAVGCFVVVGTNAACIGGFGALRRPVRWITPPREASTEIFSAPNPRASCTQNKSSTARASSRAPPRSWCSPNSSRTPACGFAVRPHRCRVVSNLAAFAAFNSQCTPTAIHSPVFPPDESCDGIESARDRNHPRSPRVFVSSRSLENLESRDPAHADARPPNRSHSRALGRVTRLVMRRRIAERAMALARATLARETSREVISGPRSISTRALNLDARATFRASRTTSKAFVDALDARARTSSGRWCTGTRPRITRRRRGRRESRNRKSTPSWRGTRRIISEAR